MSLEKVLESPGIYVFARRWGSSLEALYVGQGSNLRSRIKGQMNNVRLMQHLVNAKTGRRIVLFGRARPRPGQRLSKVLNLLERALIRYFLSEGHDLVNRQGVRIRRHEVNSTGRQPKRFIPALMYLERARKE